MPLLICSYVTNMTIFQDPSRRKEGMNLEKVRTHQSYCIRSFCFFLAHVVATTKKVTCILPFIEGWGSFASQHGESTVDGAAVLARTWVHEPCLDHIHGRGHHRCAEACAEGGGEVAGQVVWWEAKWHHALRGIFSLACRSKFYGRDISLHLTCHQIVLQNELFDDVIGHQLGTVHNGIAGNIGHTT